MKRPITFYKQLMPVNKNVKVADQFGWLPCSVFIPEKRPALDKIISDGGDPFQTKRSNTSKYLPSLRYSKFHPHLAEIIIRYWSMPKELIVDPFSGRSTRGIISVLLNRRYKGYEIVPKVARQTQRQMNKIKKDKGKIYISNGVKMKKTPNNSADLVFTCPPYFRLERYESTKNQLSDIKNYDDFLDSIQSCAYNIMRVLKAGRFLCWICADWRQTTFYSFHIDCIEKFKKAGLQLWDIIIIKNHSPFVALQAGKVAAKRYTSKTHEYLLVFRKPV